MLLEPSSSRVCQGERGAMPSWNTSVSPPVQLSITASVTGFSFRGAQLVRGKLCTSKPHRLFLLITKDESPSLAQQPNTGMICSAFISCSWERRRTQHLVNHVLAVDDPISTLCSLLWHERSTLTPTEGCTPEQVSHRDPTFKLEPGTLILCNSLSPANIRSSMTEPSWSHGQEFPETLFTSITNHTSASSSAHRTPSRNPYMYFCTFRYT